MNEQNKPQPSISANITARDISGPTIIGSDNVVTQQQGQPMAPAVTPAELDELRQMFEQLRLQIQAQAPADKQTSALERVDELQAAIADKEPDFTTMQYVKQWFAKHLPQLTGTVTGIVIHPIVGKVVEAAGELAAADFRDRFGQGS
jgi:hypothetical protein